VRRNARLRLCTGTDAEEHAGKARDGASHKRASHTRSECERMSIMYIICYACHIFKQGMVRVVLGLRDLSLDVPAAHTSLVALLQLMLEVFPPAHRPIPVFKLVFSGADRLG
jgi:hypothetical protein